MLEDVARHGARLILQTALEVEITEFRGRDRYARGDRDRAGHRNGYKPTTVKTTAGPVEVARPKLRAPTNASPRGCSQGCDQDQRVGVTGHRRLRPRAVDP